MPKVQPPGWPTRTPEIKKDANYVAPDDPRYPIFKQLYTVRVPASQLRTIEDLRQFGVVQTGIEEYDRQMATEHRVVMLPISRLVELHKEGARIAFVIESDTKKAYDAIEKYLTIWKEKINGRGYFTNLNTVEFPAQDLMDLDNFAHAIYEKAKWLMGSDFVSKHMELLRRSGARGILSAIKIREDKPMERQIPGVTIHTPKKEGAKLPQVELDETLVEEDQHPKRESLADAFRPRKPGSFTIHGTAAQPSAPAQRTTSTTSSIERMLGNQKGKAG